MPYHFAKDRRCEALHQGKDAEYPPRHGVTDAFQSRLRHHMHKKQ